MNRHKQLLYRLLVITYSIPVSLHAIDNPHFYRATNFFGEPRLGRTFLSTLDLSLGFGTTHRSRNSQDTLVPLLDLYGSHNMHELGVNVPNKDLTNPLDLILNQLALIPARDDFASFSIGGRFIIIEGNVLLVQNFAYGFFAQLHIPMRHIVIKDINFCDLSPTDEGCPNIKTPMWQTFLQQFDAILTRYCLSKQAVRETGLGDISFGIGWTYNYQETEILDFVDITGKAEILLPTSKKRNEDQIFSIPLGYNRHVGFDLSADFALGAFEWLTMGLHGEGIIFTNKTHTIRMKTALNQSGLIKLAKGDAVISKGPIWMAGAFLKADHFIRHFSLLVGYSFTNQSNDEITPCDTTLFNPTIANSDEMFKGFKMHTMHFWAEYDFSKEDWHFNPRIAAFYNLPVGGKRIFNTSMGGGIFGIDIVWQF